MVRVIRHCRSALVESTNEVRVDDAEERMLFENGWMSGLLVPAFAGKCRLFLLWADRVGGARAVGEGGLSSAVLDAEWDLYSLGLQCQHCIQRYPARFLQGYFEHAVVRQGHWCNSSVGLQRLLELHDAPDRYDADRMVFRGHAVTQ